MVCDTFPMLHKLSFVREHRQRTLVMLSEDFGGLRGWGGRGLSDSIKKGKIVINIFLSDNAK